MASPIGRRKFLATLGGAAASWPLAAARAAAGDAGDRVPASEVVAAKYHTVDALRRGLQESGYVEDETSNWSSLGGQIRIGSRH
jgi:hypothetical protein